MKRSLILTGRMGNTLFQFAYGISNFGSNITYIPTSYSQLLYIQQLKKHLDINCNIQCIHSICYKNAIRKQNSFILLEQSEKMFDVELIRKKFVFKDMKINIPFDIDMTNSVGIHIRRGDYVKINGIFRFMSPSYYMGVYDKYFQKNTALIATDDIEWCKENIHIPNAIYIDEFTQNEVETLYILSRCKHHIGSCSTFSWWGTWINEQLGAINIYPSQWFNLDKRPLSKEETYIYNNIIPDRWIKVDY